MVRVFEGRNEIDSMITYRCIVCTSFVQYASLIEHEYREEWFESLAYVTFAPQPTPCTHIFKVSKCDSPPETSTVVEECTQ